MAIEAYLGFTVSAVACVAGDRRGRGIGEIRRVLEQGQCTGGGWGR